MSRTQEHHGRPGISKNPEETTGVLPETSPYGDLPEAGSARPLSLAWITNDLLSHTRDVWSRHLGRAVSEDEAIDMLLNVKRLAETLLNITRAKGGADERGDMGAGIVP